MGRQILITEFALFLGVFLMALGNGLHGVVLALRADIEGFPILITGIIVAAYSLGFFFGALAGPKLVARVGHIRTFSAYASLASAGFLCYALLPNPIFWTLVRFVLGFCFAIMFLVAETWVNDKATNETRGRLFALYLVVNFAGTATGYAMVNLGDPASFELFVILSVAISLSLVPLALTSRRGPEYTQPNPLNPQKLYQAAPLAFILVGGIGLVNGSFFGLVPIFATEQTLSTAAIGWMMTVMTVGGLLFQYPAGWLSDKMDRRKVAALFGVVTCAAVVLYGLSMTMPNMPLYIVTGFVLGGLLLLFYPLSIAIAIDSIEHNQIVDANATMLAIYSIGAVLGPVIATGMMQVLGGWGLLLFILLTLAGMTGFALFRVQTQQALNPDDQGDFVPFTPMPTSAVVLEMDNRVAEAMEEENNAETTAGKPKT